MVTLIAALINESKKYQAYSQYMVSEVRLHLSSKTLWIPTENLTSPHWKNGHIGLNVLNNTDKCRA